jgi:hypothetical protein
MKVSIDFDDTLSLPSVQRFTQRLIKAGHEVHIVTSRMSNERAANPNWNDDLFIVAGALDIAEENVHFCNLTPKWKFFRDNPDFAAHLDDDSEEVESINKNCPETKATLFVDTFNNKTLSEFYDSFNG